MNELKDTLNGGYNGLFGEVVTDDCYKLRQLNFIPDVIIDCGANVGVFTRFAKELFPDALIVAVEPHKENCEVFKRHCPIDVILLQKAIGKGQLWHNLGASNGSGESYVSSGVGYEHEAMVKESVNGKSVESSPIQTVMPKEFIDTYVKEGQKFIIKIDIEGGEHAIFSDEESMKAIAKADYVCMELHLFALHGGTMYETMALKLGEAIGRLMMTHSVSMDNVNMWAKKNNF